MSELFSWEDIQVDDWKMRFAYVKTQIDDFGYISAKMRLKKVGNVYRGLCPFHNEKTPSFTVYPKGYINEGERQDYTSFYCFGCGKGGDIIKFKQYEENLETTKEACEMLEKEYKIDINGKNIKNILLKEKLEKIKHISQQHLNFNEINLICSSMCFNHLDWVRENYSERIDKEFQFIENFYKEFDEQLQDMNMIEANENMEKLKNKINNRKKLYKELKQNI